MTESILEEAQRLIHGPRNKNYGHPRENFADIAALWSGYLDKEVSDIDVANLMILMKVARVKGTGYHRDSFTDIAGYAGCVERIYEEPEEFQNVVLAGLELIELEKREEALRKRAEHAEKLAKYDLLLGEVREPRVWDSIHDVPVETRVRGRDGSKFETHLDGVSKFRDGRWVYRRWDSDYDRNTNEDCAPFTEAIEPRVWDRIGDVPRGVIVTDKDGDSFRWDEDSLWWRDGSRRGWKLWGDDGCPDADFSEDLGPFTEVLEGS